MAWMEVAAAAAWQDILVAWMQVLEVLVLELVQEVVQEVAATAAWQRAAGRQGKGERRLCLRRQARWARLRERERDRESERERARERESVRER